MQENRFPLKVNVHLNHANFALFCRTELAGNARTGDSQKKSSLKKRASSVTEKVKTIKLDKLEPEVDLSIKASMLNGNSASSWENRKDWKDYCN